jgi:hypothetical protein
MTVGHSDGGEDDGIDLIARGQGAVVSETRLNVIALDEMRDPATYEGAYDLDHEDSGPLHVRDYSRDIFVPVRKARLTKS